MGMQQQNAAAQISACAVLGRSPSTVRPRCAARMAPPESSGAGAGFNRSRKGGITSATTAAYANMVACQPKRAMPPSNTKGHTTPAMY